MKMDMRSVNILLAQAIGSGKIMRLKNGYSGNEAMEDMFLSPNKCVSGLFILTRGYAKHPCTASSCVQFCMMCSKNQVQEST